jgi:hypothetical protein
MLELRRMRMRRRYCESSHAPEGDHETLRCGVQLPPGLALVPSPSRMWRVVGLLMTATTLSGRVLERTEEEEELALEEEEPEEAEEADSSEYETDSEDEDDAGRAMLKPVFVPKVRETASLT